MSYQETKLMDLKAGHMILEAIGKHHAGMIYEETESAPIASITDGAGDVPLKKLEVAIEPAQDLHGYDHPWPAGGGKNLLPYPYTSSPGAYNGVTFTINDDGTVNVSGTSTSTVYFNLRSSTQGQKFTLKAGSYIVNGSYGDAIIVIGKASNNTAIGSTNINNGLFSIEEDTEAFAFIQILTGITINGTIKPMIRLSSVSDDSFAPYKNLCPISGWDSANVTGTGKNLFDKSKVVHGHFVNGNDVSATNADFAHSDYFPVKPGHTYYCSPPWYAGVAVVTYYDSEKQKISHESYITHLYTTPDNCYYVRFNMHEDEVDTALFNYPSTDTQYNAYSGSTTEYAFPTEAGEVPGGKLTIWQDGTGTLVVKKADLDLGTIPWMRHQNKSVFRSYNQISDMSPSTGGTIVQDFICDSYKTETWSHVLDTPGYDCCICEGWTGASYIAINDSRYNDYTEEQFQAAMSGVHVVYNLATPVVYNLTAQDVIALLKGNNNLWADCGNISIEYPADTKLYIDGKMAEIQALILENISNS